jgi:fatty-acyl-CoA synthase
MPDKKWGERPLAAVVLLPEFRNKVTGEEIRRFCEDKMPKWQIPDAVLFLDSLPMTSAGKKDKKQLRAERVWERVAKP